MAHGDEARAVCRDPVVIEDFFATILELAGVDWRGKTLQAVDGVSFVPLLKGVGGTPEDRAFVWHFPNNYSGQTPFSVIRQGRWKLIFHHADRRLELFDIDNDIGETRDQAEANPATVAELAKRLTARLIEEDAQMPTDKATGRPIEFPSPVIRRSPANRVACLGDSITLGAGANPAGTISYPAQLAALLGSGYEVRNFRVGGTTLLSGGGRSSRLRWNSIPILSCCCSA